MPVSRLKLIKRCTGFWKAKRYKDVPRFTRGLYALFRKIGKKRLDVVYIGMAGGEKAGIRSRLRSHYKRKAGLWTHFSIFEVWDNITEGEVRELEGIVRHIYRKDKRANSLAKQKGFRKLRRLQVKSL
jgi:hypothetical protein